MFKLLFYSKNQFKAIFVSIMSCIAGAAAASLAFIINRAVGEILAGRPYLTFLPFFLVTLAVLIITKRIALRSGIELVEKTLEEFRNKISNQIRQSELAHIESLDMGEIFTKMAMDTKKISRASQASIRMIQALISILLVLLYIFRLSITAFFIFMGLVCLGVVYYRVHSHALHEMIHTVLHKETELFDDFGHILDGFKELKINHEKNEDFFHNHLSPLATMIKKLRIRVGEKYVEINTFSFIFTFYLSLGSIVFLLPVDFPFSLRFKMIVMSAFLWEPIISLIVSVPEILQANVSAERLYQLEQQLKSPHDLDEVAAGAQMKALYTFKKIRMENLQFDYTDKEGNPTFSTGPVSLTIKSGEILFLVGGNGSGKSTLLKLITGLYSPVSGTFAIDRLKINMTAHRYLFSVVYTDCHLFDGLYGIESVDDEKVNQLLSSMELFHKIRWQDNRFHYSGLSTGQGKRLALIVAMLEDKPIYVFDEWAAEQDPGFRKYFYEELLPSLKADGKTIIAATHDEQYFHVADQVLKMEYGKIENLRTV
ncbi:MAG: cyclic peptide export ABC transporter [Desulfobacterales bacterium]|nr:cyclic peptide export ABC transporter [Desulfobacterales bacterium]